MLIYMPDDSPLGLQTLLAARNEYGMTCRPADQDYMGEKTWLLSSADQKVIETEET